jgi:RimJ/RimL family protein N-acetyltransferase
MPVALMLDDQAALTLLTPETMPGFVPEITKLVNGNPDVRAINHWIRFLASKDDIAAHYTSNPEKGDFDYALSVDGRLAGLVGLKQKDDASIGTEVVLSYSLSPEYRKRGLASRSIQALMEHAEGALRPDYFTLYIGDHNRKSQAVAQRTGFVRTDKFFEVDSGAIERRYERRLIGSRK